MRKYIDKFFNFLALSVSNVLIFSIILIMSGCAVSYSGMSSSGSSSSSSGGSSGGMSGGSSGGMSGGSIRGLGGQNPGGSGYPNESNAERKARLEGSLEKSVGGFDEALGEEQREISTVSRNTEGFGGGQRGAGRGVGLGKQGSGGMRGTGESTINSQDNTAPVPTIGTLSDEEIKARTPDDIPTLVSEDIVAKQLREAALSEDDPVLRERLWEEYRNYNQL